MTDLGWRYLTQEDKAQIARGVRDGVAHGGPYHVEIYPADRCNIECFFCSTAAIRGTDELPLTRLEELLLELKEAGTRSIRLAGGGEPLFHRKTKDFLRAIGASGIPIENITTNAVLLDEEVANLLIDAQCEQVTVSLNTGDETTYASMMQTPPRNFERVLKNVSGLIATRRARGVTTPKINLQYLVWKENYRTIPRMYSLARELGVDTILFNGLAFLKPEQNMTAEETAEMMKLYEDVVRIDEYRTIGIINSFEQDLSPWLKEMNERVRAEQQKRSALDRALRFIRRDDFTLREKLAHRRRMREQVETDAALDGIDPSCLIGWYSLVVRTSGLVAPCCILQASMLGNVFKQSLRDVWYGEPYTRFRQELSRINREREAWEHDPERDATVVPMCGPKSNECTMKNYYFRGDVGFVKTL
jgi:MoaA/NifB/PqqE/SkfB family radical SAM enzyme